MKTRRQPLAWHRYAFLSLLLLTVTLSCERDDVIRPENSVVEKLILEDVDGQSTITSETLRFKDLPHLEKISKNLKKTQSKLNQISQESRIADSKENTTTVITDKVIYMAYDGSHTYTFRLDREQPDFYVENLVLHFNKETLGYDEYIVQYNMTSEDFIDLHEGNFLTNSYEIIFKRLGESSLNLANYRGCTRSCKPIYVDCRGDEHHAYGDPTCPHKDNPELKATKYNYCEEDCTENENLDAGDSTTGGESSNSSPGASGDSVATQENGGEPCPSPSGGTGVQGSNGECPQPNYNGPDSFEVYQLIQNINGLIEPNLTQAHEDWLRESQQNFEFGEAVYGYIHNNRNDDAKAFAIAALDEFMDGGFVDIGEARIFDSEFNDYPCAKDILMAVYKDSGAFSDLVQQLFNTENSPNLIYRVADLGSPNLGGTTNTLENTSNILTIINENSLTQSSELSIVNTLVHETIHAILYHFYYATDPNFSPNTSYGELAQQFMQDRAFIGAQTQHEYMIELVDLISGITENWANSNGYNNLPNSYMENLAWSGLTDTQSFEAIYMNSPQQRQEILDIIQAENFADFNQDALGNLCE